MFCSINNIERATGNVACLAAFYAFSRGTTALKPKRAIGNATRPRGFTVPPGWRSAAAEDDAR
jgi:hypothetical protein